MRIVLHLIEIILLLAILYRQKRGLSSEAEAVLSRIETKAKALADIVKGKTCQHSKKD